jgi:O-antigen ligase
LKKLIQNITHANIAFLACLGIIVGLYTGKAIMSIGVTLLMVNAIINKNAWANIKATFSDKFYLSIFLIFLIYVLSGFNSSNMSYFGHKIQLHLPFLALPFGFAILSIFNKKYFLFLFLVFVLLTIGGCTYSLVQYLLHKESIDAGYSFSKVLPTPFQNDHIRFSISVVASILFCIILIKNYVANWHKILLSIALIFLIIYLHILAVKTGLLAFYVLLFCFVFHFFAKKKFRKYALALIIGIVILPIIAFNFSTTFRNKIYYTQYSFYQMLNANKEANISDEGRMISYKIASSILKENYLKGVGAGDVQDEMTAGYNKLYGIQKLDAPMLLPHNQFLMMCLVAGIIGGIGFLIFLCAPLINNNKFYIRAMWFVFFIPLMVEPMHETQYGITLHLVCMLLIYRYCKIESELEVEELKLSL